MARFLITTADERSWKFDRPALFLGDWCRRYDQKHIWSSMDAIVAAPYGLHPGQKEKDYFNVETLCVELLVELGEALNKHHGTNHSQRYWGLMLGHWMHRYLAVILNRFSTLEQVITKHKITETCVFNAPAFSLAMPDTLTFLWAINDDIWNNILCSNLLEFITESRIQTEAVNLDGVSSVKVPGAPPTKTGLSAVKKMAINGLRRILPTMSRTHDAFIVTSTLPLKEDIKLQLLLGQVPQLWGGAGRLMGECAIDYPLRKRLSLDFSRAQGFERCARSLLTHILPSCFLEGYATLQDQVRRLPWPTKPRFIFTSNSFDCDETFKAWAGLRIEEGFPYFTGQHGGNYGTWKYCYSETECVRTSDKFLTWGWVDENEKHVPAFVFTRGGQKKRQYNPAGGLLLIEVHGPDRAEIWDEYPEFQLYQEEQFRFVESLPVSIQQSLTVRLHGVHKKLSWCEDQRWRDRSPDTKIDSGTASLNGLIANNRLVVHSYDSTGILETLSQNVPTLCFWQDGLNHLRDSAKPYYEKLQLAGILHSSAEMVAKKVTEIWGDIPSWWETEDVQRVRREFCDRYAVASESPARTLKDLLIKLP